jgi:hypothetical protein
MAARDAPRPLAALAKEQADPVHGHAPGGLHGALLECAGEWLPFLAHGGVQARIPQMRQPSTPAWAA